MFALLSALYLIPFMRVLLLWSNEGTLASGAVRVLNGEVFARDFFEVMGPGTLYLLAGMFKLFGTTFLTMRVYLFLVSWGTGIAVYMLAARLLQVHRLLPCLIIGATYYGLQWPGVSHHVDGNFFALLAVLSMVLWNQNRKTWLLLGSGALAAITACIHLPKGVLLLAALLAWLVVRCGKEGRVAALSTLAGFAIPAAMVCGYFWGQHALGDLYYANVVWPSRHYEAVNHVHYGLGIFHEYWSKWAFQKGWLNGSIALASILIFPFLYVAALPALLIGLLFTPARRALGGIGGLYLGCGAAIWVSEWHRPDIYHLVFGSPLLVIVSVHLANEWRTRAARGATQMLAVTSSCLMCFNLFIAASAHTTPTRVGPVGIYKGQAVIHDLMQQVTPGEMIFAYPYCPIYYFLTGGVNPTRFLTLTYNYNTTEEFRDAIQSLETNRVRFVIWDRRFQRDVLPVAFAAPAAHPPDGPLMEGYLQAHYLPVKEVDGIVLLERRNDPPGR